MTAIRSRTSESKTAQEYWAGRRAVGVAERSRLGRVRMSGSDSLDLLHRLSTQDLNPLLPGQGAATVLTSDKGRIIDVLTVLHNGEELLLVTSADNQNAVAAWLDRYTIIEDVTTTDVTGETGLLSFFGPLAELLAEAVTGRSLAELPLYHHVEARIADVTAALARSPEPGGGFLVWVHERGATSDARGELLDKGKQLGAEAIGPAAYEMLRIEAGLPSFGHEIDERFNPLEAGVESLISFTKGCYIGQEVVARLDTYDKVQKRLMGLLLPAGEVPPPGIRLEAEGKEAGFVTSATLTPARERPIAMAYLRKVHARPGARVTLSSNDGPAEAEVVALPFGDDAEDNSPA